MPTESWQQAAAAVQWNIQSFIDGRYLPSASSTFFDSIDPASETILCRVPSGTATDVDAAVRSARKAFEAGDWSRTGPARRAEVLFKLAELVQRRRRELALFDSLQVGKPIVAAMQDAERAALMLRAWAGYADKLFGESAQLSTSGVSINVRDPRGVIGAITPWNFPVVNAVSKFAPALAVGNAVVLKPSELSAASALLLAELALEAGLPEGTFNVVPGLGATTGAALAAHPDIDMISFTGSTATGRKIMELAGRSNGKPLLLECGGKSPHIVFEDVRDLNRLAEVATQGLLRNQGQVCSAHTRLIVHESIKDRLLDQVITRVRRCQPGHPLDESTTFGPLASPAQRDRVKRYVEQGIQAGAEAVLKGEIQDAGGCYATPTIFDGVTPDMSIVREEIFGPVLCVQAFSSEDEAVALANGTEYALMATAWTCNLGRALRLARSIKAGGLSIRTSEKEGADLPQMMSFEPQRASGFGSELGLPALESYSTLKWVSFCGS